MLEATEKGVKKHIQHLFPFHDANSVGNMVPYDAYSKKKVSRTPNPELGAYEANSGRSWLHRHLF